MKDSLTEFWKNSIEKGRRSTIISPLNWILGFSLSGLLFSARFSLPWFITNTCYAFFVFAGICYFACYIYKFFTEPDSLRSENYLITKMNYEHKLLGDDTKKPEIEVEEAKFELVEDNSKSKEKGA